MTSQQASAARRLLGWSFEQLAQKSGVPVSSVYILMRLGAVSFEHDHLMQVAFEREGIRFSLSPIKAMIDINGKVDLIQYLHNVNRPELKFDTGLTVSGTYPEHHAALRIG